MMFVQAYTSGKIMIESDATQVSESKLITEEKDLSKLKIASVKNAVAVPVLDKQNGAPLAVIMVYNYDAEMFEKQMLNAGHDQRLLWDMSSLISSVLFNVENLQGVLGDNDLLAAQFNCVNDGVLLCNAELSITKMNKSAEILFNSSS